MKRYCAGLKQWCVPIIDGMVVAMCREITVFDDGTAEAVCNRPNEQGNPYVENGKLASVTIRGKGYAIPMNSFEEVKAKMAEFPVMPLDRLRQRRHE